MPLQDPKVRVGSTGNRPELVETIPIARNPDRPGQVVLTFGPESKTDSPFPDLEPGDRLLVFAELEVTTDAEEDGNPGQDRKRLLLHAEGGGEPVLGRRADRGEARPPGSGAGEAVAREAQPPPPSRGRHLRGRRDHGRAPRPALARRGSRQPRRRRQPPPSPARGRRPAADRPERAHADGRPGHGRYPGGAPAPRHPNPTVPRSESTAAG